jgi:cobalt-zinc-cadmium efflux system membrane fusion protein
MNARTFAAPFLILLSALAAASCLETKDGEAQAASEGAAQGEAHAESEAGHDEDFPRIEIDQAALDAAGVKLAEAGPGIVRETLTLTGRIMLQPSARAEVRAPYPGLVKSVERNIGDMVARGDVLARVESAESLQSYAVTAPIAGTVLERATNVGDVTDGNALFLIGDLTRLQAELNVVTHDIDRIKAGQTVSILGLDGEARYEGKIASVLPITDAHSLTLIARAPIAIEAAGALSPGMAIRGEVVVGETRAAVVAPAHAVQSLEGETVIFVREGGALEARPVTLGRSGAETVEVTAGLEAGDILVAENAFLVKAEIGKRSAEHGH